MLLICDKRQKFRQEYPPNIHSGTTHKTPQQTKELLEKRSILRQRLIALEAVQAVYMPCAPAAIVKRLSTSDGLTNHPKDHPLASPHSLTPAELQGCAPGLARIEQRLRDAQLSNSLERLRIQLHVKAWLVTYKNWNVQHQKPNMRTRHQIDVNEAKIIALAEKYRAAHAAKLLLSGHGDWEKMWHELAITDVCTLLAEDDPVNSVSTGSSQHPVHSEGRRTTSWIWMGVSRQESGVEAGDVNASLQEDTPATFFINQRHTYRLQLSGLNISRQGPAQNVIANRSLYWKKRSVACSRHWSGRLYDGTCVRLPPAPCLRS